MTCNKILLNEPFKHVSQVYSALLNKAPKYLKLFSGAIRGAVKTVKAAIRGAVKTVKRSWVCLRSWPPELLNA